jgi:putative transposase
MMPAFARRSVMKVDWKDAADEQRLAELAASSSNAKQRDRYRVVLIAGRGLGDRPELQRQQIAAAVGRSRQFVDAWVRRYRTGGIEALVPKPQPGATRRLTAQQEAQLCAMLEAGPVPEEGIAAYNGPILRQRIEQRFGKVYSLNGVYKLLHRLGYNDLMPRPRHSDTDPAALEAFKKTSCRGVWLSSRPGIPTSAS